MSLTVPEAGLTAGRAAQPQYEAPRTGEAIAGFGEAIKGLGDRIEKQRLDLEWGRAQLDMTRDLNNLRLKYEQMGDPEAIDKGWATDVAALKQSYLTGKTDAGGARIDAKIAPEFDLAFDDLAQKHAFALGTNVIALRHSQGRAIRADYSATVAQTAATADPATAETVYAQSDKDLQERVARGEMTPEQAQSESLSLRQNGDFDRATRQLQSNPEGLRTDLEAGAYKYLTPGDRARLDAGLATAAERAVKATEKVQADDLAAKKGLLQDALAVVRAGRVSPAEGLADDPALAAAFPDLVRQLKGAAQLRAAKVPVMQMTLPQLDDAIASWEGQTFAHPDQMDGLDMLQRRRSEVLEGARKDPVALWKSADMGVGNIDFSSGDALAASLAQRATDIGRLAKGGYLKGDRVLDTEEAAQLKDMAGLDHSPEDRLGLAMTLQGAFGAQMPGIVTSVTGDETLGGVASMLAAGDGNQVLARQILAGQRLIADKGLPMPSDPKMKAAFNDSFGAMFGDGTGSNGGDESSAQGQIRSMTFALYAYRIGKGGVIDPETLDTDAMAQAAHEVMGGTGKVGSSDATGGVQMVGGEMTFLPTGMKASEAEDGLSWLRDQISLGANPALRAYGQGRLLKPEVALRVISVGNNVPAVGPDRQQLDITTLQGLSLRLIGGNRYSLVLHDNQSGDVQAVYGDDGKPYEVDIDKLMHWATKAPMAP